jgi:LysM repeat protein
MPEPRRRKIIHVVKSGDTLPSIARRYRISADDLRRWNKLGTLTAGQKLVIYQRATSSGKKIYKVKPATRVKSEAPRTASQLARG